MTALWLIIMFSPIIKRYLTSEYPTQVKAEREKANTVSELRVWHNSIFFHLTLYSSDLLCEFSMYFTQDCDVFR